MPDHPPNGPRQNQRRGQQRSKSPKKPAKREKHNGERPPATSPAGEDTKPVAKSTVSKKMDRLDSQARAVAQDMPPEQPGKGHRVEDKSKRNMSPKRSKTKGGRQHSETRDHGREQPTKLRKCKRSPGRKFLRDREEDYRGRLKGVAMRDRGESESSVEGRRGRSHSPVGTGQQTDEPRGRSPERGGPGPSQDRNGRRTRSQSIVSAFRRLMGRKPKRHESRKRVVYKDSSILFWEDESKSAQVQIRLDCIRAGSYDDGRVIYLRVSVEISRGNIDNIKMLLIGLRLRCPYCKKPWGIARYSPKQLLGQGIAVDRKNTQTDQYGAQAGFHALGVSATGKFENTNTNEEQRSLIDRYALVVTEADNILMSRLAREVKGGVASPPSRFKLQIIAKPPCDSGGMDITADLELNDSPGDGSWRPVSLKDLSQRHNYGKFAEEDWKKRDTSDLSGTRGNKW